ncbi:hypothetical protein [Pseudonocardia sp.]|uniref:hypothetical protein n=1 Tax=Pseudonocardia sp. TaxID=60912 RepID=UPI003D1040C2
MSDPSRDAVRRWPLHGAWRVWLWFSAALGAAFVLAGVATAGFALTAAAGLGRDALLLLLPAAVLTGVGTMITWQVLHTATDVLLHGDGTLVLRRPLGALRTHVGRVRSVRDSVLRSTHTPTVVETADGWVYLVRNRREKAEIVGAIRGRSPAPGPVEPDG